MGHWTSTDTPADIPPQERSGSHAPFGGGLQAERTLLAWQRTLIVLIAVALLYLRDPVDTAQAAVSENAVYRLFPVLGVLLAVGFLIVHLRRRWRSTGHGLCDDRTGRPPAPVARPWALVLASAATALLAFAVAVGAVLG
ncbi:hypothetical protein GCM10027570_05330 [Streptomonospora sediminis]